MYAYASLNGRGVATRVHVYTVRARQTHNACASFFGVSIQNDEDSGEYCDTTNCDHIGLKEGGDSWNTRGERSRHDSRSCKKRESATNTISRRRRNVARNLKMDDGLCWTGGDWERDCSL